MPNVFEALSYVNPSGKTVLISDTSVTKYWELRGRSGFSAPDVELITQKFANGTTKVLKRFIAPRTVKINMVLVGDTTADRDQYFAQMVSDLIDIGGGNEGKLYVTRSDGTQVYLNCTYSSGMNVVDEYRKFHRFTLEFYASDPYFYKDLPSITLLENRTSSGSTILSGPVTVVNDGGVPLQPVIRVKNSTINAGYFVFMIGNNAKLSVDCHDLNLTNQETLIIDTRELNKNLYVINSDNSITPAWKNLVWNDTVLEAPIPVGTSTVQFNVTYPTTCTIGLAELLLTNRYLSA